MKKPLFTIALILWVVLSYGQNPSMTISHSGLSPYDTLTVFVGDSIDFFHGGGGPHPMTEGWQSGEASTPVPFETVTVTPSNPAETFTINTAGTYYFHCGTFPGNSDNWGMITVVESGSTTEIPENKIDRHKVFPNPVTDILTIEGFNGKGVIFNINGKKVMDVNSSVFDVSDLPKGMYIFKSNNLNTHFIKK
ncbi:MAG: hypothetical protein DRJ05_01190 [Bacteroidetes bacterium]|nr:MAG: hypothetical protein DRJ05_01190 [Bacteroidota bacterium]